MIYSSLERLHRLKVNRVRVTIAGRSDVFFGEPVMVNRAWTLYVTPWPATKKEDVYHPGFDYSRFYLPYWQKIENKWAESTGQLIAQLDPYKHPTTTHPRQGQVTVDQPRTSDWVGFASFQNWSRTQHAYILEQRALQRSLGRIIPQVNEEYGYEDHYPLWGTASRCRISRCAASQRVGHLHGRRLSNDR